MVVGCVDDVEGAFEVEVVDGEVVEVVAKVVVACVGIVEQLIQ